MKPHNPLCSFIRGGCSAITALVVTFGSISALHAAPVTWTDTTTGTHLWSDGTNWSPGSPAVSGDDLTFNALTAGVVVESTVDSDWATAGSVNGITFNADSTSGHYTINQGAGVTSLTIGAGGITNNRTGSGLVTFTGNLVAGADQQWNTAAGSWNNGRTYINGNLASTAGVEITVNAASNGAVFFQSGNSDDFNGSFKVIGGGVRLLGNSQLGRLGSTSLTMSSVSNTTLSFDSLTGVNQSLQFATPMHFVDEGSTAMGLLIASGTTGNSSLAFTGAWSGALNDSIRVTGPPSLDFVTRFQQDASTLTSTRASGSQTNSAAYLSVGEYSIENANAFGTGNSLSMSLGNGSTNAASLAKTSLYVADGLSAASALYANRNYNGTVNAARSPVVTIGVSGPNTTASFSGTLTLEYTNFNANTDELNRNRGANVHLQATSGSTVTFSGNIVDSFTGATGTRYVPVIAQGGGTLILSGTNSSYRGGTSVIDGTILRANGGSGASGSATGLGNVVVGYDAANVTGNTTSGQSFITGVTTTNLHVGQTITGAGIPDGTIITFIHPTVAGRIEISNNATATASGISISASAETGVLAGDGRIRPGVVNDLQSQIAVASGSSIAPGNSIGTLTLDSGGTTAPLLTMASGAKFIFELGAANTSDQVAFWNFNPGDFVLNDNVIDFSGAQLGTYTLFTFYNDDGSTATPSGISSGLIIGTGLDGFSHNLSYNTDSITLTVVPEPSTAIILLIGLAAAATRIWRRSRVRV